MKIEEVLQHLRNGGKVTSEQIVKGLYTAPKRRYRLKLNHKRLETFDDIERISVNLDVAFDINDFEIVEPIKFECNTNILSHNINNELIYIPKSLLPYNFIEDKKYYIKFEEIEE